MRSDGIGVSETVDKHHKFVSPQVGNGVLHADSTGHTCGDFHQKCITAGVPQLVVDVFEAVDVNVHDSGFFLAARAFWKDLLRTIGQQTLIGQMR